MGSFSFFLQRQIMVKNKKFVEQKYSSVRHEHGFDRLTGVNQLNQKKKQKKKSWLDLLSA